MDELTVTDELSQAIAEPGVIHDMLLVGVRPDFLLKKKHQPNLTPALSVAQHHALRV